MVIKTIRWKTRSFNRLIDYISKDAEREGSFAVLHNLRPGDLPSIAEQFRANDSHRKIRANGVVLYHEILSVSALDRASVTPEILEDLCRHYLKLRAPNALAFAQPHFDKGHLHLHIGISGTEFRSHKTLRMNNAQFERVRRGLEEYQLEHYGEELKNSIVYTNKRLRAKENIEQTRIAELEEIQKAKAGRHLEQELPEEAHLDDVPELEAEAVAAMEAEQAQAEALQQAAEQEAQAERQAEEAQHAAEQQMQIEEQRVAELERLQQEMQAREQGLERE